MHGWAIGQRISQMSNEVLLVGQGSLYPALHKLEQQGWIEAEWGESDNNRRAKYYHLTRAGRRALKDETAQWERLSAAISLASCAPPDEEVDDVRLLRMIQLRLRSLFRGNEVERELDAELRDHLERQIESHRAAGLSPADARVTALREFGNVPLIQEQVRDTRRVGLVEDALRDLRYALRSMRRAPGYTAVATLSLALAIGANTAIFSLVNVLLLRDVPVARPHEVVEVGRLIRERPRQLLASAVRAHPRRERDVIGPVLAMSRGTVALGATLEDAVRQPIGRYVSGNFFETLGLSPVAGRLLSPDDDRAGAPGASTLTVIAYKMWQREFGETPPSSAGRSSSTRSHSRSSASCHERSTAWSSVAPTTFSFRSPASRCCVPRACWACATGWLAIAGRLRPGVARATAKADLDVIFARERELIASATPDADAQRRLREQRVTLRFARAGLSEPRDAYSRPVLLLMGAVGLVLLIACANVVTLLLTRGMARRSEIGLRLAIGASRGRLVRQLLTESALLGLIGGAIGLTLATWGTRLIAAFIADGDPRISFDTAPDGRVLTFTAVISLGSALLAGMTPALRAAGTMVTPGLRDDGHTLKVSRTAAIWTRALIVTQVALSLLLLTGASLLVTSLRNLYTFDAGFERNHVVLMRLNPGGGDIDGDRRLAFYRQVLERARTAPGVSAAGLSLITPISGGGLDMSFGVQGQPRIPGAIVYLNHVSYGYFAAMGTRLLRGREFGPQDGRGSTRVAVINEALSRRYFRNDNPIGQRIRVGREQGMEIVGVVANAKYLSLREEDQPTAYLHVLQVEAPWGLTLVARTSGDPVSLAPAIRRDVQVAAGTVPIGRGSSLSAQIDRSLVTERLMTWILGAFAVLALLLASVGLYGVLAYAVTRRTNEIGIRLALGATRKSVLWPVLRESWTLVAIGAAIGVPAALALTRLLSTLLFGITPTDPWVLSGAVTCLFVVALAAASYPAWRAVREYEPRSSPCATNDFQERPP